MLPHLPDVTRQFARGEAPLEALREAARRAEPMHQRLADAILGLIAEWEASGWDTAWSRNELRARAKQLVPAEPPPAPEATESFYDVGLRGQRRRS